MTQTATSIKTNIEVKHSKAPFFRTTAKQDFPEYGITSGETVYLVYSDTESKAQGKRIYHIVKWNYERVQWACPCKATVQNCTHVKTASQACKAHKACTEMVAAATLAAKKQATGEMVANETGEEYAARHTAWCKTWSAELAERDAAHAAKLEESAAAQRKLNEEHARKQQEAKRATAPLQPNAFSILRVTPPTKKQLKNQVTAFAMGRS